MKRCALLLLLLSLTITACQAEPSPRLETEPAQAESKPAIKTFPEPTVTAAPLTGAVPLAEGVVAVEWQKDKHWLVAIDPVKGGRIEAAEPILLHRNLIYAYAPDGRELALLTFEPATTLHLVDLTTWTDTRVELDFERPYYCCTLRYSRDGTKLAVASSEDKPVLYIVDLETLTVAASGQAATTILAMQFTQDGRGLMVYGRHRQSIEEVYDNPIATLYGTSDLIPIWKTAIPDLKEGLYPKGTNSGDLHAPGAADMYQSGLAFAPDRDVLYIAHSDSQRLTTVDFSAQGTSTVEIARETTWIDRLMYRTARPAQAKIMDGTLKQAVLSPDGDRLYVMGMINEYQRLENGEFELRQTPLNLQAVRVSDGALLAEVSPDFSAFSLWFDLSIAGDGSALLLMDAGESSPSTLVFDPETLELVETVPDMEVYPGQTLNGDSLLLGFRYSRADKPHQLATFTPAPLEQVGRWAADRDVFWLRPRP